MVQASVCVCVCPVPSMMSLATVHHTLFPVSACWNLGTHSEAPGPGRAHILPSKCGPRKEDIALYLQRVLCFLHCTAASA